MEAKETIIGKVVSRIYQSDNFSIVEVETQNSDIVTVKGYNLPSDTICYIFFGHFITDKQYGENFVAEYFELYAKSKNDIVKYMAKTIDGIGKKKAEKFYDLYGTNAIEALKDYSKIARVVGNNKTAEKIYESAKVKLKDQELYFLLMKYEIPMSLINKIVTDETKDKILANPFCLGKYDISFPKMNKMAIDLGSDLKSETRISAAIRYYLMDSIASKGNLFSYYDETVSGTLKLLNTGSPEPITSNDVNKVLRALMKTQKIKVEKCNDRLRIYDYQNFREEDEIANRLLKLLSLEKKEYSANDLKPYIQKYEEKYNVELSEKQKLAVITVMNNNCSIITGSAGTGKTTVLKFCINIYRDIFKTDEIALLAPTGRAARRMSEATNWEAKTIHSKLCISKNDGNVNEGIEDDIVFVDEMSMTGTDVMFKLLVNSAPYTKYVFIGDPQQLPSVEAGNVLKDLISSEIIPVVKLDVIYRQMKESLIISNANKIVKGVTDFNTGDDFEFINKTGSVEIQKEVLKVFSSELFERVNNINEVQIITPMREKGYLSAKALNLLIQENINPPTKTFFKVNGYEFRKGDKVICQKNTDEVKNGEIGIITGFIKKDDELKAEIDFYGSKLYFSREDLRELNFALAYAITVHKSQGSEFKTVILPINSENKIMLKRNLLYTAVTRASEKMIIVGSRNHYWDAVRNNVVAPRNTALTARLLKKWRNENGY